MTNLTVASGLSIFEGHVRKEADRDVLGMGERIGNAIALPFIAIFVLLLLYIQGRGYLFTADFDSFDQALLFGSILYGIAPNLVRLITARRNLGRLLDVIGSVFFVGVGIYFLSKWPFDFSSLYLAFPQEVQSAFQWITDPLAMALLSLAVVVTALSAVYGGLMYVLVGNELRRRLVAPAQ